MTTTNGDETLSRAVVEVMKQAGKDGVVTVAESSKLGEEVCTIRKGEGHGFPIHAKPNWVNDCVPKLELEGPQFFVTLDDDCLGSAVSGILIVGLTGKRCEPLGQVLD